ncbi:hypothetical protein Cob_v003672 [Colletotrichum orbiculare MAFF 240422]|uniref:Uncharacterized protein n=1 Tax=Colletotrichum orbiculare (strain 104-T / ATCC 96160 / CBS 514.97 / LARS 414 / MAFF 240422) TaxID=1213857 RepID=A0A484FZG7_COLOR|nr:hypothetical protein Cob_v003672 [Colletotrichum orbiculare MAFF 240422]
MCPPAVIHLKKFGGCVRMTHEKVLTTGLTILVRFFETLSHESFFEGRGLDTALYSVYVRPEKGGSSEIDTVLFLCLPYLRLLSPFQECAPWLLLLQLLLLHSNVRSHDQARSAILIFPS